MFIDALSGVLSGAGFGEGVATSAPGNFFWALDVEAFLPAEEFQARMNELIAQIKDSEPAPGTDELFVTGERGERRRRELTIRGAVALQPAGWQILTSACDTLAVPPPTPVNHQQT